MKLFGSPASPYVRKARVLAKEKNLDVEFVVDDPWAEDTTLPTRNPFGKVPVLEIGPNNHLFESALVVHYLDQVDGRSMTPRDPAGYWQTQWWLALGQGLLDATIARLLETRRPEDKQMPEKMAREEARIQRALALAESAFKGSEFLVGNRCSLADIAMAVALQYIDFRYPHDWRSSAPKLARWHLAICARPSMMETMPPNFAPPV